MYFQTTAANMHAQCFLVMVHVDTAYQQLFHAVGKFCENQLKARQPQC